jgi:cell division septal protein FtsQ
MEHTTQPIDRLGRMPITPQKKSHKSFFIRVAFIIFLIIFIIIAAGISILRNNRFQFNRVQIFGAETFPVDTVELFTKDYLKGFQFTVVPKSSTLLFSKTDFELKLKQYFPIINIVYVTFPKPNIINIHIQEKKPVAVWCFSELQCGQFVG